MAMDALAAAMQLVPIPALGAAVSLVGAIWKDVETVQSNKAQCTRLAERAQLVLQSVHGAVEKRGASDAMQRNIAELERALEDIDAFVRALAQKSFFRRFLNKGDIADQIQELSTRLQTCCELFSMKAAIDAQAWLTQDAADRATDTVALRAQLDRALANDAAVLRTLQLHQDQLLDALHALHRRLDGFERGTVERRFAESGLAALQRASGGAAPGARVEWEISAFDLEWDEVPLDAGGFGRVHRGLWRRTEVAIKFLPAETRPEVLRNEVDIWRRLSHPHIHRFLGCSVVSSPLFIVSELCANGNATQFLRRRPHTNRPRLIYQIALGMEYLHSKGVLHGDLKASNVLIDEGGNARMTDFGLSSIYIDIATQSHRAAPMPVSSAAERWKAPEALQGGALSPQVDAYAWSMTAYEVLTGKVPFGQVFDVFTHVVTRRQTLVRPAQADAPALTNDLWALMQDAGAREPNSRPLFAAIVQRMSSLIRSPSPLPQLQLLPTLQQTSLRSAQANTAPIFHFPGRFSAWPGPNKADTMTYVEMAVPALDLRRAFTLSAWARRGGIKVGAPVPPASRCALSLESGADQKTSLVSLGLAPGNGPLCASLRPRRADADYTAAVQCAAPMPAYAVPRDAWLRVMWVHVALVCEGREVRMYMNGVHQASARMAPFEHRPNVRLVLGRGLQAGQIGHQWDGMVENVKVFQSALSPDEILDETTSTKPSLEGSGYFVQPFDLP